MFENLESLRGINILNYEQSTFDFQIEYIDNEAKGLNSEVNIKEVA